MRELKSMPIFKVHKVKKWTPEEDEKIRKMIKESKRKNWKNLTTKLNNKSVEDCLARYKSIFFKKGKWTKEEDEQVLLYYNILGKNWGLISKILKVRNWKQVRDRFLNYLDPRVSNEPFTNDEDSLILSLYEKFGTSWRLYESFFPDRTADLIKVRFYSTLKTKYFHNYSIYSSPTSTSDNEKK
jgi:transcriptional activator Myb